MHKILGGLAALALALCASLAQPVCAAQAHIDAWNQNCAAYHFGSYPQSAQATFGSAYQGCNFSSDFAAIQFAVSVDAGPIPPLDDGDLLNATLSNL